MQRNCTFCKSEVENTEHLIFELENVKKYVVNIECTIENRYQMEAYFVRFLQQKL